MTESKIISIFDFGKSTQKFWKTCNKQVLDEQDFLIEHEYLTAGKAMVKPIFLVLGKNSIYKVTVDKLKSAPLATMHLQFIDQNSDHFVQLNTEEPQFGFRLTFQTKSIEIFTGNKQIYDQWKAQLRKTTLLSSFHDSFMVSKLIGKGSFAKVYLATKKETNTQYAIKAFSKSFMLQQHKGIESLLNEMHVMRKISHSQTVTLHEVHETANSVYFVVDIISGGELLQRVREQGFLSPDSLQKLSFNLLSALNHLHQLKIVHRDLKPENLLLRNHENNYDVVLADFGLAACLQEELLFKRCGTPGFVAPEILEYAEGNQLYDEKCDVFSAGVILYLLITGGQPFLGKDQKAILKANKDCLIDFNDQLFKAAQIQLQDLVKLMLLKRPHNRISSAEALRHGYFKELIKQTQQAQQTDKFINQLDIYDHQFKNALKTGSGDISLEQRQSAFNGNCHSIDSISQMSNASLTKFEQKAPSQVGASKFSQYSARLIKMGSREFTDIPSQSKPESKRHIDLHRLAIQNSHRKQMASDQFEDQPIQQEHSDVSNMVRMYNSTRQIRIPEDLLKSQQPTTPKIRKTMNQ